MVRMLKIKTPTMNLLHPLHPLHSPTTSMTSKLMATLIRAINSTSRPMTIPAVRMEMWLPDVLRPTEEGVGCQKGGIRMLGALLRGWRRMPVVCMLENMVVRMAVVCMLENMVVRMLVERKRRGKRRRKRAKYSWLLCKLGEARENEGGVTFHRPGHWMVENAALGRTIDFTSLRLL